MSIYAMSDLHLPLGINKPMDVFGLSWENYVEKIADNWNATVRENDTVLICGDVSWATYIEQSVKDFEFIQKLSGKKIVSKGNHDYWWTTAAKLEAFKKKHGFDTVTFLHNNATVAEGYAVCCARGWKSPFDKAFTSKDEKIYEREIIRLRLSLESGKKLSGKLIAMLHYPPDVGISDALEEFNVEVCVYGHLHGESAWENRPCNDRSFLVSADYLSFVPKKIF